MTLAMAMMITVGSSTRPPRRPVAKKRISTKPSAAPIQKLRRKDRSSAANANADPQRIQRSVGTRWIVVTASVSRSTIISQFAVGSR